MRITFNNALGKSCLALAISLSLHAAARADTTKPLATVVVTANRQPLDIGQTLASVTVIDREQIETSQAPDLIDLLSRQAGIDVARTGGPGQSSTVFMRGTNSNHTLVLVDGIRVNPSTQGSVDFAHLPLAQIERIEIVRGPRAAFWGSDAIGGVIQIFTRDPSRAFFEARAGSYGLAGASAGIGVQGADSSLGIAAGREDFIGFSATNAAAFGHDDDRDGYRNSNLSLRGNTMLGSQRLSASGLLTAADVQFDQGRTAAMNRVFGLHIEGPVLGNWTHALALGHSSEDLDTPAFASRFGSARDSIDWINTLDFKDAGTLSLGLNASRETGYSVDDSGMDVSGFHRARRNAGAFVSWRGQLQATTLEASLRRDHNSQFNGATTANFAWGFQANDRLRLRASWGQGFRAPNFNELYYPGFFGLFQGNPGLQPEQSQSVEAGVDWQASPSQRFGLSAYRTSIHGLIAFDGQDFQAININRAQIHGVEADYHYQHGRFSMEGNATLQRARDVETGFALLRRPGRKAVVSVTQGFSNAATVGADLAAFSSRKDFGGTALAGYARLDARLRLPLAHGWIAELRLENVLDRRYALVEGYNTPGRSGVLSVRWDAD